MSVMEKGSQAGPGVPCGHGGGGEKVQLPVGIRVAPGEVRCQEGLGCSEHSP